jgi:hypothetical protein
VQEKRAGRLLPSDRPLCGLMAAAYGTLLQIGAFVSIVTNVGAFMHKQITDCPTNKSQHKIDAQFNIYIP